MAKEEDVGVIGGVNVGLPILMTMGAFLSIALYNVIELTFLVLAIFKQRKGLYFWSLIIANCGIVPHSIGFILKFFQIITINVLSSAIVGVGWTCMVTGQSLVLYSRLHLVVQDKMKIRWVLRMIIFNAIVMHCPVIVLALCSESTQSARFVRVFTTYDKIQIVAFFLQEAIISIIYIYDTVRLLGYGDVHNGGPLQKLLAYLIFVNIVVLVLDITLLATQFTGHYEIQTTYKTAIYSIKLKIEFSVLNRMVRVIKNRELLGNRRWLSGNSFSLGTWASSKKTQLSTSIGSPGTYVNTDGMAQEAGESKWPMGKTSEISIKQDDTVGPKDEPFKLDTEARRWTIGGRNEVDIKVTEVTSS